MLKLKRIFMLLTLLTVGQAGAAWAQNAGKPVKWTPLGVKNNEFTVYMPEGYIATGREDFKLGRAVNAVRVEKQVKIARYINGVVLLMEYYEGSGAEISKVLLEREKVQPQQEETVNGFHVGRASANIGKEFRRTEYYTLEKGFYILRGYAKTADDKILKGFFESVRLTNGNNVVAPNASANAKTTSLPTFSEQETPRLDDATVFDQKEVDRQVITLQFEPARFSFEARRGISSVRVKLKALYSSSGKITKVEVVEISSRLLEKEAIEAARKIVFIPAEKDGKLVSVYQTIEYSFDLISNR